MSTFDPPLEAADNSTDEFDPYYKWLSIPPNQQPPNLYRLLGVEPFEEDREVISCAVDRQAAYVRSCKLGQRGNSCEDVLTEIFQAKVCLLDPVRKAEYDQGLRDQLTVVVKSGVAQVGIRQAGQPKRRKKKSVLWEVTKTVLGGIGGLFFATLMLWYGLGVDPLGVMAPKEPNLSKAQVEAVDRDNADQQLKSELKRAHQEGQAAKRKINNLQTDNVGQGRSLAGRQQIKSAEDLGWIDLLKLIDVNKHVVVGRWSRNKDGVSTEPALGSRITVPSFLDGSYEISVDFTKQTGNESVSVILPVHTTSCVFYLSGWENSVHGLGLVDETYPGSWRENYELAKKFLIVNNQRYRLDISVNIQKDTVTIDTQLDRKPLYSWQGKIDRLSISSSTTMPNRNSLGLGASQGRCTFHRVELRLLGSGTGASVLSNLK